MIRRLACLTLLAASTSLVALDVHPAPAAMVPGDRDCLRAVGGFDLQTATIADLRAAMEAGRLTSAELVDTYLARIAAYDAAGPRLNSVRELNPRARQEAAALDAERRAGAVRGPLHGVPVLLKDNVATKDMTTTAGSIALEGAIPTRDATITARLREAGAIILGKANLSEFANWMDPSMPSGYSSLGGQVVNAHNFADTPSGSSSGSGVAGSMAFSAATIGTETSGSILSPSEANGIVGLKTTRGLVSRAGILPLSPEFDVPGPMVRSVSDAAEVLDAIAGKDDRDAVSSDAVVPAGGYAAGLGADKPLEGVRIAYSKSARDGLNSARRTIFSEAIATLEALGATVVGVDALAAQYAGLAELGVIPNDFKWSLNAYLRDELPSAKRRTLSEVVAYNATRPDRVKYGQRYLQITDTQPGVEQLAIAMGAPVRVAAQAVVEAALAERDADAILTPGNVHANIGAAAGYPTVVVPAGYIGDGTRPFGIGFLGTAYSEDRILRYAEALERATGARVPPTELNEDLDPVGCGEARALRVRAASGALATVGRARLAARAVRAGRR